MTSFDSEIQKELLLETVQMRDLTVDPKMQMRTEIDRDTVLQYAENVDDLPPPVVFQVEEGGLEDWYLVDGFHRFFAHEVAERDTIDVVLHKGKTYREALTYAMSSNYTNGQQPDKEDRAKSIAILFEEYKDEFEYDSSAVIKLLSSFGIPKGTVRNHTKTQRDAIDAKCDEKIKELHGKKCTQREIAEVVGCTQKTVSNRIKTLTEVEKSEPVAEITQDSPVPEEEEPFFDDPTPEEEEPIANPADAMNKEIAKADQDRKVASKGSTTGTVTPEEVASEYLTLCLRLIELTKEKKEWSLDEMQAVSDLAEALHF